MMHCLVVILKNYFEKLNVCHITHMPIRKSRSWCRYSRCVWRILYGIFSSVVCLCGYNSVLCPLGSYRFVQQSNRVVKLFSVVQRMQGFARRGLIELNMAASFVCVFTDRLHLWFSYVTMLSFKLYVHWVCISVIVQGYSAVEFVFAYLV